jgi:hypothetical protein
LTPRKQPGGFTELEAKSASQSVLNAIIDLASKDFKGLSPKSIM